jgi:hypothetical protein
MTEIDLQSWEKLQNLKAALLEATRLEGFDHVQPAVDHLMGHLATYKYTSRQFDVLMGAIHHLAWLLKHKTNEVHALRHMISKLCPSDLATQILEKCDQGMEGPHAASFHCPVCGASRPNQEAPGRKRGTVAVLQRLCDDCIKGEAPPERQALARKPAAMEALADDEHAGRSRPVRSSWWRRLTTWRRHRLPAARMIQPNGRDPKRGDTT